LITVAVGIAVNVIAEAVPEILIENTCTGAFVVI
jgi:hypothetical protein